MSVNVRWEFDKGFFQELAKQVNYQAHTRIAEVMIDNVKKYVPRDTDTLMSLHRIDQQEYSTALYYGSPIDDRINIVAIVQHEKNLGHYGRPGQSMRIGITSDIPGSKWAIGDTYIGKSARQKRDYGKGYRQKRPILQHYKTEFLKNAMEDIVRADIGKYYRDIKVSAHIKVIVKGRV